MCVVRKVYLPGDDGGVTAPDGAAVAAAFVVVVVAGDFCLYRFWNRDFSVANGPLPWKRKHFHLGVGGCRWGKGHCHGSLSAKVKDMVEYFYRNDCGV